MAVIDQNLEMFSYYYCALMLTLVSIDSMLEKMLLVNHLPCDTFDGDTNLSVIMCPSTNSTVNHVMNNRDENLIENLTGLVTNDSGCSDLGCLYRAIVHFDNVSVN